MAEGRVIQAVTRPLCCVGECAEVGRRLGGVGTISGTIWARCQARGGGGDPGFSLAQASASTRKNFFPPHEADSPRRCPMRSHWLLAFLLFVPFTASAEDLGNVSVNLSAPNSLANTHGKGGPYAPTSPINRYNPETPFKPLR